MTDNRTENERNTDDTICRVLGLPPMMFNTNWRDDLSSWRVCSLYAAIAHHHPGLTDHMNIASSLNQQKAAKK